LVFIKYIFHLLQAAHCSQILFENAKLPLFIAVVTHIIYSSVLRFPNWILQILASLIFFFTLLYTIYTREGKLRVFKKVKKAALKKKNMKLLDIKANKLEIIFIVMIS
jgi:hypothetical protein